MSGETVSVSRTGKMTIISKITTVKSIKRYGGRGFCFFLSHFENFEMKLSHTVPNYLCAITCQIHVHVINFSRLNAKHIYIHHDPGKLFTRIRDLLYMEIN